MPREPESAFTTPFVEPIATMFTVPTGYNFHDPACRGVDFICWPTVGASGIEYYASKGKGIPGWDRVLLVTTLKRGSLYVLPLTADGKAAAGHFSRYFQSENRYRDTAVSPDGRTIYIATDPGGLAESMSGGSTGKMQNPGAILAFTYEGEGGSGAGGQARPASSGNLTGGRRERPPAKHGCAACHGSTMTDGTFGPPLAAVLQERTVRTHRPGAL